MNKVEVKGIFQFIARDGETSLVAGGLFVFVIGIIFLFFGSIGGLIMFLGFMIMLLGIVLYVWNKQNG